MTITQKQEQIQNKLSSSTNIKTGAFTDQEIQLYKLDQNQKRIILDFQQKLPILQSDNENWINGRDLWEQLGVGRDYNTWIKQQIEDIGLEINIDYEFSPSKGKTSPRGGRPTKEYYLKVSTAKEVAMIAGAKGGRTSAKLKEMSRLARKYFLAVEKAFKNRESWNYDRAETLIKHESWRKTVGQNQNRLRTTMPNWSNGNVYAGEVNMVNHVLLGKSARDYLTENGYDHKKVPLRNILSEEMLEELKQLQEFDADLIGILGITDINEREKLLRTKLAEIRKNRKIA